MNFWVDRWRATPRFPDGACPACFCRGLSVVRQAGRKPVSREGLPSSVRRSTLARSQLPNGLEYAEKTDREIAEGCNRLIRNSTIYWNYLYLTQKIILVKSEEERKRLLDIIETHCPQSWASFNMPGEFDFSDEKLQNTTGVLPPKSRPKSSPKIGRRQIDEIYAVSIGYRKS